MWWERQNAELKD
jgi:hypothetical protein